MARNGSEADLLEAAHFIAMSVWNDLRTCLGQDVAVATEMYLKNGACTMSSVDRKWILLAASLSSAQKVVMGCVP